MAAKAQDTADELRELVGEAHGLMKDLRRLLREMRAAEKEVKEMVAERFEAHIEKQVVESLEGYTAAMREHTEQATQTIYDRYDQLAGILLDNTDMLGQNETTLEEIAIAVTAVKGLRKARYEQAMKATEED